VGVPQQKRCREEHSSQGSRFLADASCSFRVREWTGVYEICMSGSRDWAGITPTQPSPIMGEGFRYPREGCVISFRRHDTSTRIAFIEMTAQCQKKAKSMAAAQRRCLLAVFRSSRSLFLAVLCRRRLAKSEGSCGRGWHPGCIFAGFTAISATPVRCSAGEVKRGRKLV
jgi:hypothetical protein